MLAILYSLYAFKNEAICDDILLTIYFDKSVKKLLYITRSSQSKKFIFHRNLVERAHLG